MVGRGVFILVLLAVACGLAGLACDSDTGVQGEGGILDSPVGVAVHWPYAYVTNANFDLSDDKAGWLSVVDLRTAMVRRDKAIIGKEETKPFLGKIVLTADGETAYVADRRNNSIRVFDLADPERPAELDLDPDKDGTQGIGVARQPYGLALKKDESQIWAACIGSGHVSIVDLTTQTLTRNIPLSHGVNEIVFDRNEQYAYVTNLDFNSITVLDAKTGNFVSSFGVPGQNSLAGYDLRGLAFTPDGETLFVAAKTPSILLQVDASRLPLDPEDSVTRVLPMVTGPMGVAVTPDGSEVWVTNYDSGTVNAVGARDGLLLRSLETGSGPTSIVIYENPELPGHYYGLTVNFLSHNLTLFDITTKEVVWAIP